MIQDAVLENPRVDRIFGLHLWNNHKLGEVGVKEGAIMASSDRFDIEVLGQVFFLSFYDFLTPPFTIFFCIFALFPLISFFFF